MVMPLVLRSDHEGLNLNNDCQNNKEKYVGRKKTAEKLTDLGTHRMQRER